MICPDNVASMFNMEQQPVWTDTAQKDLEQGKVSTSEVSITYSLRTLVTP